MGRLVHGAVLTVVGQDSMPISTAIRSLRQTSSSWFRRRATASNVPSSKKALFRLVMVPPKNRVGDAVTRRFVPALAEERIVNDSPRAQLHPAKRAFLGLAEDDVFNLPGPLEINRQIVPWRLQEIWPRARPGRWRRGDRGTALRGTR